MHNPQQILEQINLEAYIVLSTFSIDFRINKFIIGPRVLI